MRIICAPDSFKEALSAVDAAGAMARGIRQSAPQAAIDCCPIADGGEGTVDTMIAATAGTAHHALVPGPLGRPVQATFAMLGRAAATANTPPTAVIEMAAASGLALVPRALRDPTRTTTFGTGKLIAAALDRGAERIILGIGGSATTDAGCGAAQALGVRFFTSDGALIPPPITGGSLEKIARIDTGNLDQRLRRCQVLVACDVTNPLLGPHGAARVYSPQKGAGPAQVQTLERGLAHLAAVLKQTRGLDIASLPGSGAAGGLGAGAVAFFGARLRRGIDMVLDTVDFARRVTGCDLCLTGEGQLDTQSLTGKAVLGVARAAAAHHVPTVALVGAVEGFSRQLLNAGLRELRVIGPGLRPEESIARTAELLEKNAAAVVAAMMGK